MKKNGEAEDRIVTQARRDFLRILALGGIVGAVSPGLFGRSLLAPMSVKPDFESGSFCTTTTYTSIRTLFGPTPLYSTYTSVPTVLGTYSYTQTATYTQSYGFGEPIPTHAYTESITFTDSITVSSTATGDSTVSVTFAEFPNPVKATITITETIQCDEKAGLQSAGSLSELPKSMNLSDMKQILLEPRNDVLDISSRSSAPSMWRN